MRGPRVKATKSITELALADHERWGPSYVSRCRRNGHGVEVPGGGGWHANTRRLWPISRAEAATRAQLANAAGRCLEARSRRADARSLGPQRLSSAARQTRVHGIRLLHTGHSCAVRNSPARFGPSTGRGRGVRESQGVLEASSCAAALYARRR